MQKLLALVVVLLFSHAASAEIGLGGSVDDDRISLVYSADTGELSIDTAGVKISVLEIEVQSLDFEKSTTGVLGGLFDVNSPKKLFKLEPAGFEELAFGAVLRPGLSPDELAKDLTVEGARLAGKGLGEVDLVVVQGKSSGFVVRYCELDIEEELDLPQVLTANDITAVQLLPKVRVVRDLNFITDDRISVRYRANKRSLDSNASGMANACSLQLFNKERVDKKLRIQTQIKTVDAEQRVLRVNRKIDVEFGKPSFFQAAGSPKRVFVFVISRLDR